MMKKKHLFTALLALFVTSVSIAQNNVGVEYFSMGEYEAAKLFFDKELTQKPGEANYYLGEIAFEQGKLDEAKNFYAKGLAADPEFLLNKVGEGKILLKTNKNAAEDAFSAALKKDKKDPAINVAIARAYQANGMQAEAQKKIDDARKFDKKYPGIYIFEGDALASANPGEAAGRYEQAIYFDSKYVLGYLKSAKVYESIHPDLAKEKLQTVIQIDPNYILAYKYLGDINTKTGHWEDAIAAYQKYFAASSYSVEDITHYASVLYFAKKYDESAKLLEEGQSRDPNNYVLNRLLMYNLAETNQFEKGLTVADKFFSLGNNGKEHIGKDYTTYALLLKEGKQFDKALEQYKKAIEVDKESAEIYAEIADLYRSEGNNGAAAEAFKKYISFLGENVEAKDYYQLGYYYYLAGTNIDSTKHASGDVKKVVSQFLHSADSAFAIVVERLPESYTGYLWRARANASLDPETELGLAKPYYEKLVEILLQKDAAGNKDLLLEGYRYLGYYYYLKDDKTNAVGYWEKILVLSPGDPTATQVLEQLKKK